MAYNTTVGDSQPVAKNAVVSCFAVSVVPVADITDIDATINNDLLSGKAKGSMILAEGASGVFTLYVAAGSAADDTWAAVDGSAAVTPA